MHALSAVISTNTAGSPASRTKCHAVLNSDSEIYGGSNQGNLGGVTTQELQAHNQPFSAEFTLPPLSVIAFAPQRG